jgi:serine/threonine-protein kinase RsbT
MNAKQDAMTMKVERILVRVPIRDESDLVTARKHVRDLAGKEGLRPPALDALTTAVAEVARNIVLHAREGELFLGVIEKPDRRAIAVVARDGGPGIVNTDQAMEDGYSTSGSLGLGLSSARRLVDEFELASTAGEGTTVTMKKWIVPTEDRP